MFMKKKLAVLLTVTLLAACAAGCSSTAEEKKETNTTAAQESVSEASTDEGDKTKAAESDVELTFSAWAGATEKAVLEEALAGFTDATGIKVKGIFIPDDYETKISTMIASGTAPDVGYLVAPTAHDWYADGQIMDLTPLMEEVLKRKICWMRLILIMMMKQLMRFCFPCRPMQYFIIRIFLKKQGCLNLLQTRFGHGMNLWKQLKSLLLTAMEIVPWMQISMQAIFSSMVFTLIRKDLRLWNLCL